MPHQISADPGKTDPDELERFFQLRKASLDLLPASFAHAGRSPVLSGRWTKAQHGFSPPM